MIDVNSALSHESTHQYISRALAAADPNRIVAEVEEFEAILAWIAMQQHNAVDVPLLRVTYARNRVIAKMLGHSAKDYDLPWGKDLLAAVSDKG